MRLRVIFTSVLFVIAFPVSNTACSSQDLVSKGKTPVIKPHEAPVPSETSTEAKPAEVQLGAPEEKPMAPQAPSAEEAQPPTEAPLEETPKEVSPEAEEVKTQPEEGPEEAPAPSETAPEAQPAEEKPSPPHKERPKHAEEEPEKAPAEEAQKEEESPGIEVEGFKGFFYKDVLIRQGAYPFVTHATGNITNKTGRDYSIIKFIFSTYDKRGRLITEEAFHITDLDNGKAKAFKATLVDGYSSINSYVIKFKSGIPR